mmetsp:Transcript_1520/g.1351  ORF Transcript_1520/g.1351 Transcript_1520/m.1351 type:complete len:321 (-) Transcript_1520:76-1038(-)
MSNQSITVLITGAAGRIAYSLIPILLSGSIFGENIKINLRLLDIDIMKSKLEGVSMEITDSNYELLDQLVVTTDQQEAFTDVQVAILLGGYPRLAGMERKDLIAKNAEGMISQAKALDLYASKDVKVLIVANPANTNCLVALQQATSIPSKNFTALTRLDEERLKGYIVNYMTNKGMKVNSSDVSDVYIFGNHSATQVPYISNLTIGPFSDNKLANSFLTTCDINELTTYIQTRGAQIIKSLQASSALSAANAVAKHLTSWLTNRSASDEIFSMGVLSDGSHYDIPAGIVFSFPCKRKDGGLLNGDYEIVNNFTIDIKTR